MVLRETPSQCAVEELELASTWSWSSCKGRVWGACGMPGNPMLTGGSENKG